MYEHVMYNLRYLVTNYTMYDSTVDRKDKTVINMLIVSKVHECNGRFLKKKVIKGSGTVWIIQSDSEAREKVGKTFRRTRLLQRRKLYIQ